MAQLPSDDELRALIRTLSQVAGIPLTADRIELVLPSYKSYLSAVQALEQVSIPVEVESAHIFDLSRGR
jgi:hypothetical protein